MTSPDGDGYAGPATLVVDQARHPVRVRLKGTLNPFDGRYHWQGTVHDAPASVTPGATPVRLCVEDFDAGARIVERTSAGDLMVNGVGAPPFAI